MFQANEVALSMPGGAVPSLEPHVMSEIHVEPDKHA